jgi:hypothetical protein
MLVANNIDEVNEIIDSIAPSPSNDNILVYNISNSRAYSRNNLPNGISRTLHDVTNAPSGGAFSGGGYGTLVYDFFYGKLYFTNGDRTVSRISLPSFYGLSEATEAFNRKIKHIAVSFGVEQTIDLTQYFTLSDYSDIEVYFKARNTSNNTFFDARTIVSYNIDSVNGILTYRGTSSVLYNGIISLVI